MCLQQVLVVYAQRHVEIGINAQKNKDMKVDINVRAVCHGLDHILDILR